MARSGYRESRTKSFKPNWPCISRHRFKLVKRIENPLFVRPGRLPVVIKKRLLQEYEDSKKKGHKKP